MSFISTDNDITTWFDKKGDKKRGLSEKNQNKKVLRGPRAIKNALIVSFLVGRERFS